MTPRERAVWSLRAEIRRTAHAVYGAGLIETPIEGFGLATRPGLDEPLAGVRAAALAGDVAAGVLREYAAQARGAGRSWDDIAAALTIEPTAGGGDPRAEQAYRLLIEGHPLPDPDERSFWSDRPRARWTCITCGQRITDDGPFEAAPFDSEDGHSGDCARHAAEITAYWGEQ